MGTKLTTNNNKSFELKFDLFDHQKETIKFMLKNHHAYIFNQPGTGKTECAISVANYLKLSERIKKTLIISTLSTLKNVWYNSIDYHQLELNPVIITGSKIKKEKILIDNEYDTYIINPDAISNLELLLLKIKFDCIIVDEATTFKNHTSNRYKTLLKLVKKHKPEYFYLMTGTPTPNAPSDCFGLLKLFKPSEYTSFNRFRALVEVEIRDFFWKALPNAYDTINYLLQPSICFKKENVLKIANTEFFYEEFKLSDEQQKHFSKMKKDFITEFENGETITSKNAAIKLNKMLQIIGGALIDDDGNTIYLDSNNKTLKLLQILGSKVKNKAIIFCSHKAQIKILQDLLKNKDVAVITGDTSQKDRNYIFTKFQNTKEIEIIIAMPQCMAHGITLTAADAIIYYNPVFSNEIYEQANARIARPGQEEIPKIFHLYCNNTDYAILMKLQKRMSDQDYLLTLLTEE